MNYVEKIVTEYSERFSGVSIDYRRFEWEKPWRLKRYSHKNERADYRITKFFYEFHDIIVFMAKENAKNAVKESFYGRMFKKITDKLNKYVPG